MCEQLGQLISGWSTIALLALANQPETLECKPGQPTRARHLPLSHRGVRNNKFDGTNILTKGRWTRALLCAIPAEADQPRFRSQIHPAQTSKPGAKRLKSGYKSV
jgi:hypothetical protein